MIVRWTPTARKELTALWVEADSAQRHLVTAAAYAIDQRLKVDPQLQGESRSNSRRVLFEPPLGVLFRVIERQSKVRVLRVWQFD